MVSSEDMEKEIGQLEIDGISCRICVSPRRKRAGMTASEHGITLCGPACMTLADAEKILHRNQPVIRKLLQRVQSMPLPVPPPEFAIGGTLRLLGASCPVERGFGKPVFRDGVFYVHPVYARQDAILKYYRQLALQILTEKVNAQAAAADIAIAGIHIGSAQGRWGSCTAVGHLHFTWKLILCPERVVDYVVAHELAHRRHMDHSADFWAEVGNLCPDWQLRRRELRREEQKLRSWENV